VVVLGCNNGIRAKSEICTIPIDDQGMYQEVVCWELTLAPDNKA
jgi:hypothetical protein